MANGEMEMKNRNADGLMKGSKVAQKKKKRVLFPLPRFHIRFAKRRHSWEHREEEQQETRSLAVYHGQLTDALTVEGECS